MPRKRTQGEIRDKEKTMQKLLDAVGEILRTQGFDAITVSNVSRQAEVDKKLIYVYYENLEGLVNAYLNGKAHWNLLSEAEPSKEMVDKNYFLGSIENYRSQSSSNKELGEILLWEISKANEVIAEISGHREAVAASFLKNMQKNADEEIKDIYALLLAGIQFLELKAKANKGAYFGLDISKKKGRESLNKALTKIADGLFSETKKEENKKKKKK